IGWREEHRERLLEVTHSPCHNSACVLLLKIYLPKRTSNQPRLRHCDLIEQPFFSEVWLSLVEYERRALRSSITARNRALINEYLPGYLHRANYIRPSFPHAQQCSIYEGRKINAAYSNNINMRFGQHLKRAV
ncbi:hypothetical protein BX666DRAFT_2087669, partial [Dichotomocladium elegans]